MRVVQTMLGRDATLATPACLCVLAAVLLSAVSVYMIDVCEVDRVLNSPADLSGRALKQLLFALVGLTAAGLIAIPHYRIFRYAAWPIAAACIALLVLLIVPGMPTAIIRPRHGVRGWIDLGPVDLQPGELAKIAYVLVVADYLRYRTTHRTIVGLVWPGLLCAVPVALIFLQPDLGMAMLFVPAMLAMLIAAGAKLKHVAAIVLIGVLAIPAMYPFLKPYQQQRIVSMFAQLRGERHMTEDIGYQAYTAATLAGAGGFAGYPEAKSRALIKYNALPEGHNDMIFAVIVNRFGLVGGLAIVGLYLVWIAGALLTAALTREPFGRIVIVGCSTFVAVQVFINTSMVVGIAPIIGLTLPFVSYGGSSLLSAWLMTGLVMAVGIRRSPRLMRDSFEFGDTGQA